MRLIIALLFLLGGCLAAGNQTYIVDGVPVILEDGLGPERDHLYLAVQLYRQAAAEHWELEDSDELPIWRALQAIRWTNDAVPDGASYDFDSEMVRANWLGCALLVPLYAALMYHYAERIAPATDADEQWAADLQADLKPVVCNGNGGETPSWRDRLGL